LPAREMLRLKRVGFGRQAFREFAFVADGRWHWGAHIEVTQPE
jgi:hypothetical protein